MKTSRFLTSCLVFFVTALFAGNGNDCSPGPVPAVSRSVKYHFIENRGQFPAQVLYGTYPAGIAVMKDRLRIQGVDIVFRDVNSGVAVIPEHPAPAVFNFLQGNDPERHRTNVAS